MFDKIASQSRLAKTAEGLTIRGFEVYIANDSNDAKNKVFEIIPAGAQVMNMTSVTLDTLGISETINGSGKYDSVRKKLTEMNSEKDGAKMRALGTAPDYAVGSVHAITEDGEILIASATGSQLPAYAYGAGKVIFVVGTQKIVKDHDDGLKRIYKFVLPKESERANKVYKITTGSAVNKLLILNKEIAPGRITVILVPEVLGF
jgi:acyl-CoA hydrolase